MLKKGEVFISATEKQRIELQAKWELMFHGEYHFTKLFSEKNGKISKLDLDQLVPFPALISEINSDLLFGEFPKISVNDKGMDNLLWPYINEYFQTDILEAATYCSAMGTLFLYLYKKDGKVKYRFIKPTKVLWDEEDRKITEAIIFEVKEDKSDFIIYEIMEHVLESRMEIGPQGLSWFVNADVRDHVIYRYEIKVEKIEGRITSITPPLIEKTGLDFIPLFKICNLRQMNMKQGKSDYQGKEQLIAEIDNRIDQINYVIQENADPWIGLPAGVLDQNGRFNRSTGKMFEKAPGVQNDEITIAQWHGNLDQALATIDKMIELLFATSRISPSISGTYSGQGGYAESGRALKWRSISTFSMMTRKRKYWNELFKNYLEAIKNMDEGLKNLNTDNLIVEWQDGLPLDLTEITQDIISQVREKLLSRQTAIMRINEMDKTEAQKEMELIDKESTDEATIEASRFRVNL